MFQLSTISDSELSNTMGQYLARGVFCVCASDTLTCKSLAVAKQVRHFLNAEVKDLYPAIRFEAGLSAEAIVRVPRRYCTCPLIRNGTPVS